MLSLLFVPKMKMAAKPPERRSIHRSTGHRNLTSAYNSQLPTVLKHKNSSDCEPDKDAMLVKKDEQIKQLEQLISQLECSVKEASNSNEEVMKLVLVKKDERIKQLERIIRELESSAKAVSNTNEEVMKQESGQSNEDEENAGVC
jgi:tRNA G18 (ribose-2'-O)-methylase SpoU